MTDTLAFHKDRPLLRGVDLSSARLKHVVAAYPLLRTTLNTVEGSIQIRAETEALWFYAQNHAMQIVGQRIEQDEPLGAYEPFVKRYHKEIQLKTLRMFYYLLLICTRESRHANNGAGKEKLHLQYPEIAYFHTSWITDDASDSNVAAMLKKIPDVSLGEFTNFLVHAFAWPTYDHSFGGSSWKKVAVPLRDFVHGKISAEIMMDTAFTLAHNNGPIFNKGMLFTGFDTASLVKILDLQRSGQIPQAIATFSECGLGSYVPKGMIEYAEEFSKLADVFHGTVNWSIVKDVGGYHPYGGLAKKQEYAKQQNSKLATMTTKLKTMSEAFKKLASTAAIAAGNFEIMPGVLIAKNKRSLS